MIKNLYLFGKIINSIDKKRILITILLFILLPLSDLFFNVFILKYIIQGYEKGIPFEKFLFIMICLLVFQVVTWIVESYYSEWYSVNSNIRISNSLYKLIFRKMNSLQLQEIENTSFYEKYYFITNDCDSRISSFINYISNATSSFIMIITLAFIIADTDPILFVFVIFPVICEVLVVPSLKKIIYQYDVEKKEQLRRADYTKRVMYLRDYAKEIRMTRIWNVIWEQYKGYFENTKRLIEEYGVKIAIRQLLIEYSYQVLTFFAVIAYISFAVYRNTIELSNGIIIITTYNQIVYSIKNIVDLVAEGYSQSFYIKELLEFVRLDSLDQSKKSINIDKIETIEFRDVSFSYDKKIDVLKNISFKLVKGQKTAILGINGVGKTTLVKLLIGLYEPDSGEILINGICRKEMNLDTYQKKISTVLQNFKIFATNIEKNVIGKNIENKEDVGIFTDAIEKSGFVFKLGKLPKGSKTNITKEYDEEGAVLSGGEMQKIAIARAIAKKSDLLIFDEPTSALDPIAEADFYHMMENNFGNMIVTYISHNYSAALFADNIIFLSDGIITEMGAHSELVDLNGQYSALYKLQAANFSCGRNGVSE